MNTTMVHFLVEEPSMAELIQAIAPKVLPEVHIRTVPFQSKQDLLKKLKKIFKKDQVSMFEMTKLVGKHLS
mgnify:CR=1 FL=1